MPERVRRRPHVAARSTFVAYPLTPISPSRNAANGPNDPGGGDSEEMSPPPNNRTIRPRVPYLPQPSDVPVNPDSPVSEQVAGLIHEFIHPHPHHSRENLLVTEEDPDDAGGDDAPAIARELEEMQTRVWWKRPSALWYAPDNTLAPSRPYAYAIPGHFFHTCNPNFILRRFLGMIPVILAASSATAAPKVQVITHLVCKTLRPEYSDRSGTEPPITFFSASGDEETKLCNADPAVQAASAEFLACKRSPRHSIKTPESNPPDLESNHHRNWYSELLDHRILGISKPTNPMVCSP